MAYAIRRAPLLICCLAAMVWAAETPALWIDVPFVKQERNGCGAASIAMVMQYWQRQEGTPADHTADEGQIQQTLYSKGAHGIYASTIQSYFEQHAFRAFAFQGEWSDLTRHIAKGRPLIVALKPDRQSELHYVVVAGVDEQRKLVLINDPAERKLLEREWQIFEREWKRAGHWTLLAVPREDSPSAH